MQSKLRMSWGWERVNVKSKSIEQRKEMITLIYNDIYIMFRLYVMFAPQDPSQEEYNYVSRLFLTQSLINFINYACGCFEKKALLSYFSFPSSITRTLYKNMWWIKSKINSIFNLKKIIVGIYSWNYIVLAIYSVFFAKS